MLSAGRDVDTTGKVTASALAPQDMHKSTKSKVNNWGFMFGLSKLQAQYPASWMILIIRKRDREKENLIAVCKYDTVASKSINQVSNLLLCNNRVQKHRRHSVFALTFPWAAVPCPRGASAVSPLKPPWGIEEREGCEWAVFALCKLCECFRRSPSFRVYILQWECRKWAFLRR